MKQTTPSFNKPVLARFRADPELVRVSIRREGDMWRAIVGERDEEAATVPRQWDLSPDPKGAINGALRQARNANMPGIDLDMQWTYDHPWKRQGDNK